MVRTTGRRLYLVGKNEEDSKVLEHRTLRDHLKVQHPAHGCQKTLSDITARQERTPHIENRGGTRSRHLPRSQLRRVRARPRWLQMNKSSPNQNSPTNRYTTETICLLKGTEQVTFPVSALSEFHEWFVGAASNDGTAKVSELSVSTSNTLLDSCTTWRNPIASWSLSFHSVRACEDSA